MDIALLGNDSLKVKSKTATLIFNPSASIARTEADATLSFEKKFDNSKISGTRVDINGPGEYEVNGVKITGVRAMGNTVYYLEGDGLKILVGKFSNIESISENFPEIHIGVFDVDSFNDSVLVKIDPRVSLLYGAQKETALKELGKNIKVPKYSITFEKLPEETEVIGLS